MWLRKYAPLYAPEGAEGAGGADAAAVAAAAAAAAAAGGVGGGGAKPWYEGKADAETVGWLQSKGWDKDPVTGAIEAAKAHREAQKLIGVPTDQIVRWPKDLSDGTGWKAVYDRLGVPADAKDYDFSTVKNAAGEPLDAKLGDAIRAVAASSHLTKEAAAAVAQTVVKHIESAAAIQKTDYAASVLAEKETLAKNWGANAPVNSVVAQNALQKLGAAAGLTEAQAKQGWDALSKVGGIGAAAAAEMLRIIGSRMGEDTFVGGGKGGNDLPMTREAALAEITALKADPVFAKRYLEKGAEETKRMSALFAIAYAPSRAA